MNLDLISLNTHSDTITIVIIWVSNTFCELQWWSTVQHILPPQPSQSGRFHRLQSRKRFLDVCVGDLMAGRPTQH